MKSLLICAFVLYAVSVIAERCHHGDDCVVTVCSGNSSHIACHGDRCTCDAVIACTDITDCMTNVRLSQGRGYPLNALVMAETWSSSK
uniref:EB domain-containing protein n=1 Tax=Magallana gigas TaxID=29159 RepID=A0A8W8J341_MAGGI